MGLGSEIRDPGVKKAPDPRSGSVGTSFNHHQRKQSPTSTQSPKWFLYTFAFFLTGRYVPQLPVILLRKKLKF